MTAILSSVDDLKVLDPGREDPTVQGYAIFANGDRVLFRYMPDRPEDLELYMKAREGSQDYRAIDGQVPNPRPSAARILSVRSAVAPKFAGLVEETRKDLAAEVAENERRDLLRHELCCQRDAGPLLFAALEKIVAQFGGKLEAEPELATEVDWALAAGRGVYPNDKRPLGLWRYRAAGETYWSAMNVRAPDAESARALATLKMHDGRDRFHNPRAYLPSEVEVELIS